jgi:hypothetical protein
VTAEILQHHHGSTKRWAAQMIGAALLQPCHRRIRDEEARSAPFPYDGRAQGLHHLDHGFGDLRPDAVTRYQGHRVRLPVAGQRHVRHQAPRARARQLAYIRVLWQLTSRVRWSCAASLAASADGFLRRCGHPDRALLMHRHLHLQIRRLLLRRIRDAALSAVGRPEVRRSDGGWGHGRRLGYQIVYICAGMICRNQVLPQADRSNPKRSATGETADRQARRRGVLLSHSRMLHGVRERVTHAQV